MLVLTRKKEQIIRIGKDIVIKILKIQGDQVSVGINAPRTLPIVRQELLEETDLETESSSTEKEELETTTTV